MECPRGNSRSRTAQIRGKLRVPPRPIPSQASLEEGVETRRAAPTAVGPRRRDSPDHERPAGWRRKPKWDENLLLSFESAGSSPAVRTITANGHLPSPLNPVERVWLYLKQRFLSHRRHDDYEALVDEACKAWRRLTAEAGRIKVALQLPVDYEGQNLRWMVLFSSPPILLMSGSTSSAS
jgi:hypothetical protein